ncbi:glutathione peroxidase [Halosquirtibacter laminarini]|uniref:Glutathione peroxidase n=2 Tax=Halosquirtibacter laminarini TaxID=3374600 RepID=A0AC61NJP9_9BACT|nr:glutathione peroxidase [Prolixibacteraceae bacterium]
MLLLTLFFAIVKPKLAISQESFYDYEVETIDGDIISMSQFKGKKILIVNTASKCGFTSQYKQLQDIYLKYKDLGFVIIGFPCNDFGKQEPEKEDKIKSFCSINYGVTFPMMSKIHVKGDNKSPLYEWLTSKKLNNVKSSSVKWNFQKYAINRDGTLHDYYYPTTKPDSQKIIKWIEGQ